jgi:hypothetical protein
VPRRNKPDVCTSWAGWEFKCGEDYIGKVWKEQDTFDLALFAVALSYAIILTMPGNANMIPSINWKDYGHH